MICVNEDGEMVLRFRLPWVRAFYRGCRGVGHLKFQCDVTSLQIFWPLPVSTWEKFRIAHSNVIHIHSNEHDLLANYPKSTDSRPPTRAKMSIHGRFGPFVVGNLFLEHNSLNFLEVGRSLFFRSRLLSTLETLR